MDIFLKSQGGKDTNTKAPKGGKKGMNLSYKYFKFLHEKNQKTINCTKYL